MSTKANRCCLALALLACGLAVPARAQKAGAVDAVRPQATIQRSAAELSAKKGTDVSWNDLLRTGEQGRVRVMLLDQSLISVGPKSEVCVLRQEPRQTRVHLSWPMARFACGSQNSQVSASSCGRRQR